MGILEDTLIRINQNEYNYRFECEELMLFLKQEPPIEERFKQFIRVFIEKNSSQEVLELIEKKQLQHKRYRFFYRTYLNTYAKRPEV